MNSRTALITIGQLKEHLSHFNDTDLISTNSIGNLTILQVIDDKWYQLAHIYLTNFKMWANAETLDLNPKSILDRLEDPTP